MANLHNYSNIALPSGAPTYIFSNGGTKLTDIKIDYQQEFLLFDNIDPKELKQDEYLHEKKEDCKDIKVCISRILNTFKRRLPSMSFYFYNSADKNKYISQEIFSLPHLQMQVQVDKSSKTFPYQIQMFSNFNGDRPLYEGWDLMPENELQTQSNKRKISRTEFYYVLRNIERIRMWIWGYEIVAHDDNSLLAVLEYASASKSDTPARLQSDKILHKQILENSEYMCPSLTWSNNIEAK